MSMKNKVVLILGAVTGVALLTAALGIASSAGGEQAVDKYGATEIVAKMPIPTIFSHKAHVKGAGLSCDSCHPDTFEKKEGSAATKGDFTMAAFAQGKYCGACHDGQTAFDSNDKSRCTDCHTPPDTIVFKEPAKAVVFGHKAHVDTGLDCDSCHNSIFAMEVGNAEKDPHAYTMEALYKGQYCGACHDGEQAFASDTRCTLCHIGVKGFEKMLGKAEASEQAGGHH